VTDARICAPEEPRPPSSRVEGRKLSEPELSALRASPWPAALAHTGKAPPCHGARGFRTFARTQSDDNKLAPQVDFFEAKARPSPSWRACDSLAASVLNVRSRSKYRWRSPCCGRGAARTGDRCGTGNACTAAPSRISYRGWLFHCFCTSHHHGRYCGRHCEHCSRSCHSGTVVAAP
jgi:hypothetical protein